MFPGVSKGCFLMVLEGASREGGREKSGGFVVFLFLQPRCFL